MERIHLPPPSADGPDVTFNEDAANPRYAAINKYVPSISLKCGLKLITDGDNTQIIVLSITILKRS
jgi:hypothetical protein